ncbi:Methyltransferase domain-containing protein [Cruoricaptor ignavus]|uniref:Methyltransferase domain-containing protein n=1 Tax=Cruoricaptor ignavus TaxID=1118202 RepID=A0A1M6DUI6_9FLAO|nr:class I SAM-dependent methyltransferase [Cruoricaptor ignavus]SHI76835.1 Methyltransferase domain-containing protein [Cruoricaptor ignavus]
MSEISRIAQTFLAYLKRPDLYPELARKVYKNIFRRNAAFKGKEKTNAWAKARAVSQEEAIKQLFGTVPKKFSESFPQDFASAEKRQAECPVKMGGAGALELIYYACEFTKAKNVLETGVAYGWSSFAALKSLEKRAGTLYSSDMPYLALDGDRFVGCVVPDELRKNWKLFRYADRESLPKIFEEQNEFDVVHYDSDKSYQGMKWAYSQLYPRLHKGGVFISDDINDNSAFQDFCEAQNIQPTVVDFEGKFVGVFVK